MTLKQITNQFYVLMQNLKLDYPKLMGLLLVIQ